ncbi:MAG: MotA/TolQ/ExbB proton channel family protein [Pseudomonadota bacterium]
MLQFLTTKRLLVASAILCVSSLGSVANAADEAAAAAQPAAPAAAPAPAFPDLMPKVRAERTAEQNVAKERETRFRAEMEEQRKLNAKAQADRTAAEARTNRLDAQFAENETRIAELNELLTTNQGNLGELFGVTRQVAGDTLGILSASLVNTQLAASQTEGQENRIDFMRRMSASAELPSIVDLERIWIEMLEEMKNGGEVERYTAPVLQTDGTRVDTEVVRVGPFTAYGDNKYLVYLESEGALSTLSRQPSDAEMTDVAEEVTESTSGTGYLRAVVDPSGAVTGGAMLSLYVERPNWFERINNGEAVPYVIVGVGGLGILLAMFQYVYLIMAKVGVSAQLKNMSRPNKNNALGRLLLTVKGADGHAADNELPEVVELRISEAVLREIPKLERFQSFLRLAVAAGPLLGLIGTVIGMILTFESITASGSSDPKLMADGIGQAMIATVLGLGIAIPLLFVNAGLVSLSKSVVNVLEEESTSLMANRLKAGH